MRNQLLTLSAVVGLFLLGCVSVPKAPLGADGKKIVVEVGIDGGREQTDVEDRGRFEQRHQLVDFMRDDTVMQLNASGYEATLRDPATGPTAGARQLKVTIAEYNPGSAAARILVGYGAGSARLTVRAVYSDGSRVIMDLEKSMASSVDWRKIVRRINIQILQEMAIHGEF